MKGLVFTTFLVALVVLGQASSFRIDLGERQHLQEGYSSFQIFCLGASGSRTTCKFQAQGLPSGAAVKDNYLIFSNDMPVGMYKMIITATDASGQQIDQVIRVNVFTRDPIVPTIDPNIPGIPNIHGDNVDDIIYQYSSVIQFTITFEGDSYPTPKFPTDPGEYINTEIVIINSSQTTPSSANRKVITSENVQLIAATQRYQTAVKSVTNLLTIIDQTRANKVQAELNITIYRARYQKALDHQRTIQEKIIQIEIRITKILSAIAGIQKQIDQINKKILEFQNQIKKLKQERSKYQLLLSQQRQKRIRIVFQDGPNKEKLNFLKEQLQKFQAELEKIKISITIEQGKQEEKRKQLNEIKIKLSFAESDLDAKQKEFERFTILWQKAKKEKEQAHKYLLQIKVQVSIISGELSEISKRIITLNIEYKRIQAQIDRIMAEIQNLPDSSKITIEIDSNIKKYQKLIAEIDAKIDEYEKILYVYRGDLKGAQGKLSILINQKITIQAEKNSTYMEGNEANKQVAIAKENYLAVTARWEKQSKIQAEATLNLERARAEEEIAKLARNQLLAAYSNALPYAIVPNGDGVGSGTPNGNNAAGSALGPATKGSARIKIQNWTQYLSSAFGRGINPALDENINYLYTFSPVPSFIPGNRDIPIDCNGNGPVRAMVGYITQVGSNYVIANINGSSMRINYAPCTNFTADKPDYEFSVGDQIIAKGTIQNNQMNCQNAIALSK